MNEATLLKRLEKGLTVMVLIFPLCSQAGALNPLDADPNAAVGAMFTLEAIWQRLQDGTAGAERGVGFVEPVAGPGPTGHTLTEVMNIAPIVTANCAQPSGVLAGETYWGLCNGGDWGPQIGMLATQMLSDSSTAVPEGFYQMTTLDVVDTDLVSGNIRSGVTLFGVMGDLNVVNTSSGTATAADIVSGLVAWVGGMEITGTLVLPALAPVPKTGQTVLSASGDDGDLEHGVAWPSPRFTDNTDGTVTDNLTGLIWLRKTDCQDMVGGVTPNVNAELNWTSALTFANNLADGDCGLSDSSAAGDWRLPNVRELQSLIDYGRSGPALPSVHPFTGVVSAGVWSSTSLAASATFAWFVDLLGGFVGTNVKASTLRVWPVRGGQ